MSNLNDILKPAQPHRDLNRLAYGGDWVDLLKLRQSV
jgi:hypothetical protein